MPEPGTHRRTKREAEPVRSGAPGDAALSASSTHLAVEDVTLSRGGRPVLHGITMSIERARVTALVGPSGSGKSSLLRCLNRLEEPQSGRVLLSGTDIREIPPVDLRCRVGLIGQRPVIFPGGVRANLAYGLDGPETERLLDSLAAVGLPAEFLDRASDALSGGEAQRVSIARALMRDPEVLLLDEPTSGLDLHTRREFLANLVDLAAEGRTILISSHSISELERFASHVGLVLGGRVTHHGTLDSLRGRFRRIGFRYEAAPPDVRAVGTVCESARVGRSVQHLLMDPDPEALDALRIHPDVLDFEESAVNLEDVYAALTRPPQPDGPPLAERNGVPARREVRL